MTLELLVLSAAEERARKEATALAAKLGLDPGLTVDDHHGEFRRLDIRLGGVRLLSSRCMLKEESGVLWIDALKALRAIDELAEKRAAKARRERGEALSALERKP